MNTLDTLEVVPTGAALGAEVHGLDLALPVFGCDRTNAA